MHPKMIATVVTTGKSKIRIPAPNIPTPLVEAKDRASAGEDGQRGCHRGHAVTGAAAFFGDFFAFAGIVTNIAPAPSGIDGGNRSVPASIKA